MARAKRVENRSRQANWQKRKHAEGICPRCGQEKRDFNPKNGKPFRYGPRCRELYNAYQAQLMRERRGVTG